MSIRTMPDVEQALIHYLLTVPELQALVSDRVYPELPAGVDYPCLTIRILSQRVTTPRWLEACTVEVAGWSHRNIAHARKEARNVCEMGVAALNSLANAVLDDVIFAGPVATTGPRSVPDQIDQGVTNPRFIAEVSFTYHPK